MKKIFTSNLLVLILTLGSITPFSDLLSQECGTVLQEKPKIAIAEWQSFRNQWQHQRKREKIFIGITIHIVEQVSGASNISLEQLYQELDAVNSIYSATGFEFFFCGSPRTIDRGKSIYTYQEAADLLNRPFHVPNTINIFYLDEIGDREQNSFACGIATFPFNSTPETRFIIMQKGCSTNGSTLAHEIGHFFGLLHTHETAAGLELVNGSNCSSAGDLICDTPADPNLAFTGLNGCTYQARFTDARGDLYVPDPSNIMSYAPATCRRRFSSEQHAMMNFWYETELSYLQTECSQYPDYAIDATYNQLTVSSGQKVILEFGFTKQGSTPGQKLAIQLLLQSPGAVLPFTIFRDSVLFNSEINQFFKRFEVPIPLSVGSGSHLLMIILDPEGAILELDKRNNLLSIPLTIDNAAFADAVLFPNPATSYLRLFLRDPKLRGEVFVDVNDLLGRRYLSIKNFKSKDEFFVELQISDLKPGPYMVTLTFDKSDKIRSYLFIKE